MENSLNIGDIFEHKKHLAIGVLEDAMTSKTIKIANITHKNVFTHEICANGLTRSWGCKYPINEFQNKIRKYRKIIAS